MPYGITALRPSRPEIDRRPPDQILHIPAVEHRLSVQSCKPSPCGSNLELLNWSEQHRGCCMHSLKSSESLLSKCHPSSRYARPLSNNEEEVARATAHAVVAASERQSRTALTEIPLEFYQFCSESTSSDWSRSISTGLWRDTKQSDSIGDSQISTAQQSRIGQYSVDSLLPEKSHLRRRKSALRTRHSLDDETPTSSLGIKITPRLDVQAFVAEPFGYGHRLSNRFPVRSSNDHRIVNQTSKLHSSPSLRQIAGHTAEIWGHPVQRTTVSLKAGKEIRSQISFCKRKPLTRIYRSALSMLGEPKSVNKLDSNSKMVQSDLDIQKGEPRTCDEDADTCSLTTLEEKPSTSSYLKEQFFSFFQPTGNKLAMKLFGTKRALNKEKLRQERQGKWIVHPCSNFRFYWDVIMLLLLIANLIILPVAISFFNEELSIQWIAFNCISDTVFLVDIAVNFRTGVIKNNFADEIILNPREIAQHYVKTWFLLDLLSSVPLDYIYLIFHEREMHLQLLQAGRALRFLRFAKLLSLIRLLRLSRLVRYVSQWEEFLNLANKFIGIFNLVLILLLLGHWNACLQFLIPVLNEYPVDSWVSKGKLQNADWFSQYTWALFKAMSHMLSIGYGRYPPTSLTEAWVTLISMVTGATGYALFVGHAAALIQSFDCSKRLYREKFKQIDEYMAFRKLPRALRQRIANYYEHRYQGKMFNETEILNELSECLKEQIVNYNCRALVAAVPFFTFADQNFVSEVIIKLRYEVFQPGDLIIKEGTIGTKMYFIQEGIVDIVTRDNETVTSLSDGSYFGEICLLTNARRVASVRAETYCNVYSLDRTSFLEVLDNYPLMRRTMESVAAERLNKIGHDPWVVSQRKDLCDDLKLVNEIVNQTITEGSDTEMEQNIEPIKSPRNFRRKFRKTKHFLHLRKYSNAEVLNRRRSVLQVLQDAFRTRTSCHTGHENISAESSDRVNSSKQTSLPNSLHLFTNPPELIVTLSKDSSAPVVSKRILENEQRKLHTDSHLNDHVHTISYTQRQIPETALLTKSENCEHLLDGNASCLVTSSSENGGKLMCLPNRNMSP
ncbi:hypothetical protein EG68_05405 [Paragonimus skrjabini miyazakii]|uniref:Cyclic nucleotide-binding domain-containing protein n=1 Tax=Paragonimus skrjabini miyazakii TaxID=59628 RepID=A0A8S9YXG1_9TREM|nr:hypothetical protein EG68_05405 [Paragonimus skrjabini miyazakii]